MNWKMSLQIQSQKVGKWQIWKALVFQFKKLGYQKDYGQKPTWKMRCEILIKMEVWNWKIKLLRWTPYQITNNWYSKDSKIRLKCENVEVNWNPTPKTEIQKELSLRTEIYQYSFNFHSRMLRFENMWICVWCRNLQAKKWHKEQFFVVFFV